MANTLNKPLFLKPTYKDYLWGGDRLKNEFNKDTDVYPLAEAWECSTHPDGPSIVMDGEFKDKTLTDVLNIHPEYLGSKHKGETSLPILIKLIDASNDLSVQVHPTDEYARIHENEQLGKSEMWYVLDANNDTNLIYGLNNDSTKEEIKESINKGNIDKYLRHVKVKKNDVFFIDAGTIHAIGKGALIVEVQESSNLTYRLYDYDRVDKDGKKRELHIDKALEVANLKSSIEPKQPMRVLKYKQGEARELLCSCKYFEVYRILLNTKKEVIYFTDNLSYKVLLCIDGEGLISYENKIINYHKGDCIFIPANSLELSLQGNAQLLDIRG